jgi:hypothetical protein
MTMDVRTRAYNKTGCRAWPEGFPTLARVRRHAWSSVAMPEMTMFLLRSLITDRRPGSSRREMQFDDTGMLLHERFDFFTQQFRDGVHIGVARRRIFVVHGSAHFFIGIGR